MDFIADSSVVLSWLMEDENSQNTDLLLTEHWAKGSEIYAPSLLKYEVTNVLVICHTRRNRLSFSQLTAKLKEFENLMISLNNQDESIARIAKLASDHHLSAYDAAYLELAIRLKLPLATLDKELRNVAQSHRVKLLPELLASR
jgi:predicted nucleic acid-binding protein